MSEPLPKSAETITRAMLKAGPKFQTQYDDQDGNLMTHPFYTREANDSFAEAMELMGVGLIVKGYYDPLLRKWLPYTGEIFYTQSI